MYVCMHACMYIYGIHVVGLHLTLLHAPVIERTSSEKRHIRVSSSLRYKVGLIFPMRGMRESTVVRV
jgi:hypothetical protein